MTRPRPEDEYRRLRRQEDDLLEEQLGHRASVWRRALLFTPSAAAFIAVFAIAFLSLLGGNIGAVIGSVVLGIISFALGYEALAALRDLRAQPMTSNGIAERVWTKSKFLIFGKSGYLLLEGRVFEVRVDTSMLLQAGQRLRIEHWPHTNLLIALYRDGSGSGSD